MFVAPILYVIHARFWRVWRSQSVSCWVCVTYLLLTRSDRLHRSVGNSSKLWLFPIVGACYAVVYYTIFRVLIKALDLKNAGVVKMHQKTTKQARPAKWLRHWLQHSAVKRTSCWTRAITRLREAVAMLRKWAGRSEKNWAQQVWLLQVLVFRQSSVPNPIT